MERLEKDYAVVADEEQDEQSAMGRRGGKRLGKKG